MKRVPLWAAEVPPSDGETSAERVAALQRALAAVLESEVTERQREMVWLYYYENKNIIEISGLLDVNKSTVSRTLARARERIRRRLDWIFRGC